MSFRITCPNADCQRVLQVGEQRLGHRIRCPECKTVFQLPVEPPTLAAAPDPASPSPRADSRRAPEVQVTQAELAAPPPPFGEHTEPEPQPLVQQPPPLPSKPSVNSNNAYPPYVTVPGITSPELTEIPDLSHFQLLTPNERLVQSYRIRVRRPKFPWLALLGGLVLYILPGLLVLAWHFLLRRRGHTYLYLTNQRIVVIELEESLLEKEQAVLNFSLDDIAGFTLHAQRGLKRFLGLFVFREKRTFYLEVVTRTFASFKLGAINTRGSDYDPGKDAVSLCSELDSLVLALKSGTWRG